MKFPNVISLYSCFEDLRFPEPIELEVYAPKCTNFMYFCQETRNLEKVKLYSPLGSDFLEAFSGSLQLREFEGDLISAAKMHKTFANCILNKESTLRILNSIPAYTSGNHPLGIGIHVDHKTDEEVLAAIANAEAKGWTLTVQWNGTPTSGISTLNLEEIYAKVTESEYGDYTDENGNKCMLDWGHYVTDTTDYKIFFSIYEAEQYFKLTKVEEQV